MGWCLIDSSDGSINKCLIQSTTNSNSEVRDQ